VTELHGGFRLRQSEKMDSEMSCAYSKTRSDGSEIHVCGAATENARLASSARVPERQCPRLTLLYCLFLCDDAVKSLSSVLPMGALIRPQ